TDQVVGRAGAHPARLSAAAGCPPAGCMPHPPPRARRRPVSACAVEARARAAPSPLADHRPRGNVGSRATTPGDPTRQQGGSTVANKAVSYAGPGKVEVIDTPYPEFELKDGPGVNPDNVGRRVDHGVILKTVSTNICGSDQHMVRGRTTAPEGLVLGHEITGEVVEVGRDVEFIKQGDIVSVPFNIACGRCRNCKERQTGICLNVNPDRPGSAYGYVDMGGWVG